MTVNEFFEAFEAGLRVYTTGWSWEPEGMLRSPNRECPVCFVYNYLCKGMQLTENYSRAAAAIGLDDADATELACAADGLYRVKDCTMTYRDRFLSTLNKAREAVAA